MGRRRQHEETQENHERWLVSYADFITLLFAFFVVMYAISSVNEGKYRVLSNALNTAFSDANVPAAPVIGLNNPIVIPPPPKASDSSENGSQGDHGRAEKREKLRNMARDIEASLGSLVKSGQVHVSEGAFGLTVDINASLLFSPGDARLHREAARALISIAEVLAGSEFPIAVEGHTDNVAISNAQFASNWELSSVRASSVVRLFIDHGVAAARLTATGYADQRPVADNASADGRQRNRRVAITIAAPAADAGVEVPVGQ